MKYKCRACGKEVKVTKKGFPYPHLVHKGLRCVGSSLPPKAV